MGAQEPAGTHSRRDRAYFDRWYEQMETSPAKDAVLRRHFGPPAELEPAGVLPWDALDEIAAALDLPVGGLLVDVACGRGGYGIELARRQRARLVGVDFSTVALRRARDTATRRLPAGSAEFTAGTLTATGLPDAVADALLCTDSVQFSDPPSAAAHEFRRVLRSGGRLAATTWSPTTPGDPRVGVRLRHLDLRHDLEAAGFRDVVVDVRPRWRAVEHRAWEDVVGTVDDGDPASASLREEAQRSLDVFDSLQRVVAFATAP